MPKKNKYRNDRPSDYVDAFKEGVSGGVDDLKQVILHPIDTATHTLGTLSSLVADMVVTAGGRMIFREDLYNSAVANMMNRNEHLQGLMQDLREAQVPDYLEFATRAVIGGMGTRAGMKLAEKIANVPTATVPQTSYYDDVREHAKKYGKDKTQTPILETFEQHDLLPGKNELARKNTKLKRNARDGSISLGVVYGASDKPSAASESFSFFKEAHGQERPASEQKRDQNLRTFAKAYGFDLNDINLKSQGDLKDILEKQEASNNMALFSDRLNAAKGTFEAIRLIGLEFNHKDLILTSDIALKTLNLADAARNLEIAVPALKILTDPNGPIGKALATIGSVQPYFAFAAAAIQLGMAIFSKPQEDPQHKQVMAYLQATIEYLQVIRKEMHQRFDRLEGLMKELFDELFNKLDAYIEALTTLMNANHESQLKGMVYLESNIT